MLKCAEFCLCRRSEDVFMFDSIGMVVFRGSEFCVKNRLSVLMVLIIICVIHVVELLLLWLLLFWLLF